MRRGRAGEAPGGAAQSRRSLPRQRRGRGSHGPRDGAGRPGGRARRRRHAPRRHGVLALHLRLHGQAQGGGPPASQLRGGPRDVRPAHPRDGRAGSRLLDDEVLPRLRARQQRLLPAALRRDRGRARRDALPRAADRDAARAPADDLLLGACAVPAARRRSGRRRRARLGEALHLGGRAPAAPDLRAVARPVRARDRRRHRHDRDVGDVLLEPTGGGRPRHDRPPGAGIRAAPDRRRRRAVRGRVRGEPRGAGRLDRRLLLAPVRAQQAPDAR